MRSSTRGGPRVSSPPSERDAILSVYHELDVFDDVRDGVGRLRDAGYDCYVVSNGNPEMLDSMVDHADIRDLLDGVVSADEVGVFKPDAEIYRHAAARTATPSTRSPTHRRLVRRVRGDARRYAGCLVADDRPREDFAATAR